MTTNTPKAQDPVETIEAALSELTTVDQNLTKLQNKAAVETKAIVDKYAPQVDPLTLRRTELVDQISKLFEENRAELLTASKTIITRSGTLSASFGPEAIDIDDEAAAMVYTRKRGMLRRVTKVGKRSFVKDALKKFPDFVAKCPGMVLRRTEFLHIKLVKTKVEIKQDLAPYRRPLAGD